MQTGTKLFLYSLTVNDSQLAELDKLIGKPREQIVLGLILNATDIVEHADTWVGGMTAALCEKGYRTKTIDLNNWLINNEGLPEALADNDALWVCGGHTYHLNYMLAKSGADTIIKKLVGEGKVYAGWSAGAVVAGPTTRHFNNMGDDPNDVPELVLTGLRLTNKVIVPHMDNADFEKGAMLTNNALLADNYNTIPLNDNEVFVVNGRQETILTAD